MTSPDCSPDLPLVRTSLGPASVRSARPPQDDTSIMFFWPPEKGCMRSVVCRCALWKLRTSKELSRRAKGKEGHLTGEVWMGGSGSSLTSLPNSTCAAGSALEGWPGLPLSEQRALHPQNTPTPMCILPALHTGWLGGRLMPGSPGGSGSFRSFLRRSGEVDELISRVRCLNAWKRTHQITKETNYTEMQLSKYFLKTSDLSYIGKL